MLRKESLSCFEWREQYVLKCSLGYVVYSGGIVPVADIALGA